MGYFQDYVNLLRHPIDSIKANLAPGYTMNAVATGKKPKSMTNAADIAKILMDGVQAGKPVRTDWTTEKAISDGIKVSGWVFTCIDAIASAMSSVPWEVESKISNNEWDKVDDHPISELLETPNPFYTGVDMMGTLVQHLLLSGNALLLKVRDGTGTVKELWIISPDCIKPIPDANGYLLAYLYKFGRVEQIIPVGDIIHFKLDNPASRWWGMSPMQAVAKIVDTEVDAIEWWRWSLRNRAVKDGIIQFKKVLGAPEFDLIKTQMLAQMTGPTNARLPLVIGSDSTFTPTSMSPVDMDFMQGRSIMRNDIAAAFRIPIIIITFAEGASYNNSDQAAKQFWNDNILAKLNKMRAQLNASLLTEFHKGGKNEKGKKLRINYDPTDVPALASQFADKVKVALDLNTIGFPLNMINTRLRLGMGKVKGGDVGHLPSNMLPLINNSDADQYYNTPGAGGGLGDPKTETGNPTRKPPTPTKPAGNKPADKKSREDLHAERVISEYSRQLLLLKDARDKNIRVDLAEKAIVTLFEQECKMVKAAFSIHGEIGITDALGYGKDNWKKLVSTIWASNGFSTSEVVAKKLDFIMHTTKEELRYATSNAIIDNKYAEFIKGRARIIAEDNVIASANSKCHTKAKAQGEQMKQWVAVMDDRTRDSHAELNGTKIPIDEVFSNGCAFPGDPSAELEETVNCRCVLHYSS